MRTTLSARAVWRRVGVISLTGLATLALAACGSSDDGTSAASSPQDRETARLKLQQCLKANGVELPAPGERARAIRITPAIQKKLQAAMNGPCKKYQTAAFGNMSDEQREEFRDAFVKFQACMKKQGIEIPSFTPGQAPPAGQRRNFRIDPRNPKTRKAIEACQKVLPNGGRGGPGGPGGGPGIAVGPGPGAPS